MRLPCLKKCGLAIHVTLLSPMVAPFGATRFASASAAAAFANSKTCIPTPFTFTTRALTGKKGCDTSSRVASTFAPLARSLSSRLEYSAPGFRVDERRSCDRAFPCRCCPVELSEPARNSARLISKVSVFRPLRCILADIARHGNCRANFPETLKINFNYKFELS